jgi:hypothetical protein
MIGDIYKNSRVSSYQPGKDVADVTSTVKKDYDQGTQILNRSWVELNNRSVIDDKSRGQRTFNAFVDESIEDPATAWQWRGTRSKARNKAIQMHAFLTSGYIIPTFVAQNDSDEEDRDFSDMMQDTVEWMIHNSNYKESFLAAAMGMLVNPVTYMSAEYTEVYQTIKEKTEQGYTKTEVLDEVLSGFNAPIWSAEQVLISNAFEQNIQRHRFNIKTRYIEYGEAQARYKDHENIHFVQPGIKSLYSENDGAFYDIKDEDHPHLVEEVVYCNRREDIEIPFVNGIYLGDTDVEGNCIRHRDNKNAPKYNIVPFGYQRINEHFFFFKSLMAAQYWDNQLLDEQYRLGMNRAFLDTNMPMAVTGVDSIDQDIIFPSSVVAFANPEAKATPLLQPANLGSIFNAMQITENSIEESSISATSGGQLPDANQKATAINVAQRNAETIIKGVGANLAISIVQYGSLMSDIALQHVTAPQVDEIAGEKVRLKYRTLVLNDKVIDGKQVSKVLRFDESLLGVEMDEDDVDERSLELLQETGYPKEDKVIYLINPLLFSRRRYLTRVEPERMFPKNDEYRQGLMSQLYAQFQQNPYISLEALTRKTLYPFLRSETDEVMADEDQVQNALTAQSQPVSTPAPVPGGGVGVV